MRIDQDRDIEVEVGLDEATDEVAIRAAVGQKLAVSPADLPALEVRKRVLDARRGRVRFHLTVGAARESRELGLPHPREVDVRGPRVVVVGDGPAGLFCAYQLAREGIASIVVDRGKPVQPRRHDLGRPQQARRRGSRQQLLLRRGRRGHVLRRQAVHAGAQARRRPRRDRGARAARGAGRHPGRGAAAHRLEQAAAWWSARCASPARVGRGRGALRGAGGRSRRRAAGARSASSWPTARAIAGDAVVAGHRPLGPRRGRDAGRARRRARAQAVRARRPHRASAAADRSDPVRAARPATRRCRRRPTGSPSRSAGAASSPSACARAAGSCRRRPSRAAWWSTA